MNPFFLVGGQGTLFAIYYPPAAGVPRRDGVLYVPPFAEEMNKSRRMVALQARRLAAAGFGVLVPDLYGTGDSAGDFAEARWSIWREDVIACAQWLGQQHAQLVLWGLRLGGLLAAELAGEVAAGRLLLWQPVLSGQRLFQQLLRLRLTADRLKGGSETQAHLQEMLAAGQPVEVAGYALHPALAEALGQARLAKPPSGVPVHWFELSASPNSPLSPASQRQVEEWRSAGVTVQAQTVAGDSFWATQEIAEAPELLDGTLGALLGGAG